MNDTLTKILVGLTLLTGLMVLGVGALVVRELAQPAQPELVFAPPNQPGQQAGQQAGQPPRQLAGQSPGQPQPQVAQQCDPASLDPSQCPVDHFCFRGTCQQDTWTPICGEGASCRECECESGLVCDHNRCVKPEAVRTDAPVCQDPAVRRALQRLERSCQKRTNLLTTREGCPPELWREIAMNDPDFDEITAVFPNRLAVHFPNGAPGRNREWPTGSNRDAILKQLHTHSNALREAAEIYVIARASPDGSPEDNYNLARRRADSVQKLLLSYLAKGGVGAQKPKITVWSLGGERPIKTQYFRRSYADMSIGLPGDVSRINRILADPAGASAVDRRWLENSINRTVLVIPIPCK